MRKILTSLGCALLMTMGAFAADDTGPTTVPWYNDFSDLLNGKEGWKQVSLTNASRALILSSGYMYISQSAQSGPNHVYEFFTGNGFQLEKGKGYKFELTAWASNDMAGANNTIKIKLYKHSDLAKPDYNAAHKDILTASQLLNEHQTFSGFFEVEEDGIYDLCLYIYANYESRALYFDDFKLTFASLDVPVAPAIKATPNGDGILKADVQVTAPSKTIRGSNLTSITKMNIYRDGALIKVVNNPAPGGVTTLTDYVSQPGIHIYKAVAFNDKGEGETQEVMATIGGMPEAPSWSKYTYSPFMAKYTPDGEIRVEFPAITDSNHALQEEGITYKVYTMSGREITGTPTEFTRITHQIAQKQDYEAKMYYLIDDAFDAGTEPTGWQYKVVTVDEAGNETLYGYTNYLSLNNEVPFYPNFVTSTSKNAFIEDIDRQFAVSGNQNGYIQIGMDRPYTYHDRTYFYNNWLITPGLKLSADKFYRVRTGTLSKEGLATFQVKVGKGSYREALDIVVAENLPTVQMNNQMDNFATNELFFTVPEDGMYFLGIMASMPQSINYETFYVNALDILEADPTLPNVPTDIKVLYSATDTGKGTISFKVPTTTISGGEVEGLTKVEITKNGELYKTITDGITPGATLTFDIDVTPGRDDVYSICAYNLAGQGESDSVVVFVLSTPYTNGFDTQNALSGFTQINNLKNGQNFGIQFERLRLFYNELGHDIWFITPPITLTAGQYYQFNYNVKASGDGVGDCTVKLGSVPTEEGMTQTITKTFEVNSEKNIFNGMHEEWFTVQESGQYFIGFHFSKEPGRHTNEIYLDDLSIAAGVPGNSPDMGVLKVIPDPTGEKKAKLTYTAPKKALNGTTLSSTAAMNVSFYINGVQTGGVQSNGVANPSNRTFTAYPGYSVSIDVEVPEEKPYLFSAKSNSNGRPTYTSAFVGINVPDYPNPSRIVLQETEPFGHVSMSWEAVTKDYEGYDMNPDNVRYEVAKLVPNPYNPNNLMEEIIVGDINGTSCEFDAVKPNAAQTMMRYVLRARNIRGKGSQGVLTDYVNVGNPYSLPYQETFKGNDNKPGVKTAIFSETLPDSEGPINWGIMVDGSEKGVTSGDGDGCYLAMEVMWLGGKGRFFTGKVDLNNSTHPAFTFLLYNPSGDGKDAPNLIQPQIYVKGEGFWRALDTARSVTELTQGQPGWSKVSYDLTRFVGKVVILAIDATCMKHTFTSVDNIKVSEAPDTDFVIVNNNAPLSVSPGIPFNVDLNIANAGRVKSTPESIEMYVDGELKSSLKGEEIAAGKLTKVTFSHLFPSVDVAASHELKFKVNAEADPEKSDNEVTTVVATVNTHLAGVENLGFEVSNEKVLTLNWDAPEEPTGERIVEDFEKWEPGEATQFGWTSFDRDRTTISGFRDGYGKPVDLPGLQPGSKASFAVVDVENGPLMKEQFPSASGDKFLMAFPPNSEIGSADDWLITPLLSGNEQQIFFQLRTMPAYRIGISAMYSDGSMNLRDFKEIVTTAITYGSWQGLYIEVPKGAKRVAFRNLTYGEDQGLLMLDDISYEPASGADVALKGFNIYDEMDCIAQPTETTYTFATPHAEGNYVYGVSALYAHGESKVTAIQVNVTGDGVTTISEADGVHIFGGYGCIHVTGAEGENITVYDLNGKILSSGQLSENGQIPAAPGMYVVVVGDYSRKVVVK